MILLFVLEKALPALPFSMMFGVAFYFLAQVCWSGELTRIHISYLSFAFLSVCNGPILYKRHIRNAVYVIVMDGSPIHNTADVFIDLVLTTKSFMLLAWIYLTWCDIIQYLDCKWLYCINTVNKLNMNTLKQFHTKKLLVHVLNYHYQSILTQSVTVRSSSTWARTLTHHGSDDTLCHDSIVLYYIFPCKLISGPPLPLFYNYVFLRTKIERQSGGNWISCLQWFENKYLGSWI